MALCMAWRDCTWLTGGVTSTVLHQLGVLMGALTSKTTVARLQIVVPVVRFGRGLTVYKSLASPWGCVTLGGRNPAKRSVVSCCVAGSSEVNVQVTRPVAGFSPAVIATIRFCAGRRSSAFV